MFKLTLLLALMILSFPLSLSAQDASSSTPTFTFPPTDTPTPKPTKRTSDKESGSIQVIVVHKPKPPASWGRVIQYKREEILALTEKNRETLHEFIFQDEDGIIRTATFHENASGDGYWEVWVWDQP